MQKGFATLEVILAAMIIALLMSSAIPNAVRLVDRAALDYETKRLYSELKFIQAKNRSSRFNHEGTGLNNFGDETFITFKSEPPAYQVVLGTGLKESAIREPHVLSYGVTICLDPNKQLIRVGTDEFGKLKVITGLPDRTSGALALTSRLGKKKYIVFDSVGRIRPSLRNF